MRKEASDIFTLMGYSEGKCNTENKERNLPKEFM